MFPSTTAYNPLKDQKVLTGIADFAFSAVVFFAGTFGSDTVQLIANFLVLGIQPIVGLILVGMFQVDAINRANGIRLNHFIEKPEKE